MKPELVLSGKKEALKHIGRAHPGTLEKLKKIRKIEDKEELEVKENNENKEERVSFQVAVVENPTPEPEPKILPISTSQLNLDVKDRESSLIAGLETQFFLARQRLSIFSSRFTVDHLFANEDQYCPALVFTSLQVDYKYLNPMSILNMLQDYVVQLVVLFLKHNQHFQSHSWVTQAKLLRYIKDNVKNWGSKQFFC